MLNLKYLETFIRVTEAGSFHKAADLMYITPSAVIKQVKMLEDEVGAELFRRSPRGLSLTKNGESLYQDGKILLDAAENSLRRAREASADNDFVLRVGTSPITPADLVAGLWEKVYSEWPQLKIQIVPFQNAGREVNEIFLNFGRDIDIIHLNGSIEIAPMVDLCDVIVDIVETGKTLKENNLEVVKEIVPISARFIANKASYKFKADRIHSLLDSLKEQAEKNDDSNYAIRRSAEQ